MTARATRRHVLGVALAAGVAAALPGRAAAAPVGAATAGGHAADAALSWLQTTYDLVLRENLSPPAAARTYAYTAIAMYEAAVAGMPTRRSLGGQLHGLTVAPRAQGGRIDWPASVVSSAAAVLRQLLPFAGPTTRAALDAAESDALVRRRGAGVSARDLALSVEHGQTVARHLGTWMAADGHAGVGRPYTPAAGDPSFWESTPPNYRPAIEPYWSEVRPLVLRRADESRPRRRCPSRSCPGRPSTSRRRRPTSSRR